MQRCKILPLETFIFKHVEADWDNWCVMKHKTQLLPGTTFFQYSLWHVVGRWRSGSRTGVLKRGKSIKRRCNSRSQHPQPHQPHLVQLCQAMFPWSQAAAVAWYHHLCQWLSKKSTKDLQTLTVSCFYKESFHTFTHRVLSNQPINENTTRMWQPW